MLPNTPSLTPSGKKLRLKLFKVNFQKHELHVAQWRAVLFVLIFAGIGGYIILSSFASSAPAIATVEADQMTLPSGAVVISSSGTADGKAVRLTKSNTSLTGSVNLPSNATSMTVIAHGRQCKGGWANMNVSVDSSPVITNASVNSNQWQSFSANVALTGTTHTLTITDSSSLGCRYLIVSATTFYGPTAVVPAPTISFSASPTSVVVGSASTLTWSSTNTTSCLATGAWTGSKATSGSLSTGALNATTTYNLSCSGSGGTTNASATVTVTGSGGGGTTCGSANCPITSQLYWNGDFSTGDWGQYDDCLSHHIDGNWAADYSIVAATANNPVGTTKCASEPSDTPTLPSLVIGSVPVGYSYAAQFSEGPESTVSGEAGQRTLDTLWPTDSGSCSKSPCADNATTWALGKTKAYQGATAWYRDETYFPTNFQPVANDDFNWTYEIHNYPDAGADAMLSCGVDTSSDSTKNPYSDGAGAGSTGSRMRYSCRILGGASPANPANNYNSGNWPNNPDIKWNYFAGLNPLPLGQWVDSTFYFKWSWQQDSKNGCTDSTSATGCFEWWVNGTKVADYSGPTLLYYSSDGFGNAGPGQGYLQHGYYRDSSGNTTAGNSVTSTASRTSVEHAGTVIGPTATSIGEPSLTP